MKREIVDKDLEKLYRLANKCYSGKKIEKYIGCLEVISGIHYVMNDCYYDNFVDEGVAKISSMFSIQEHKENEKTVLYYDAFGLDRRGLAAIYLKALVKKNYKVIYVTYKERECKIPHLTEILEASKNSEIVLLDDRNKVSTIRNFIKLVEYYSFSSAFFYTTPWDVIGSVVFSLMGGKVIRYQINLTDHAYWIGRNSFDYCVEFRDYGINVSAKYRNIEKAKLVKLPYYPECDKNVPFGGFPFDADGKFIIFSGGALYKTFGANGLYYDMARKLLKINMNVVFWYAGSGDDGELKKLISEFPDRVFYTNERKDLLQVLAHCHLYLNTYPIVGGLMTQYAAVSGLIPLTLLYDDCSTGFLIDGDSAKNEYLNEEDLIAEASRLILDDEYRKFRSENLKNQVLTETDFADELDSLLQHKKTSFPVEVKDVDTSKFRNIYVQSVTEKNYRGFFITKRTFFLWRHFMWYFFCRLFEKFRIDGIKP